MEVRGQGFRSLNWTLLTFNKAKDYLLVINEDASIIRIEVRIYLRAETLIT